MEGEPVVFEHLSDRELLILTAKDMADLKPTVDSLERGYWRMQGGMAVLLFLMTVGIAVAGMVLART